MRIAAACCACVISCSATIGQVNAQPSTVTGKTLFDLCSPGGNNAATLSCAMYIRGFLDGYSARQAVPAARC
jgi:hypothetical protein